MESVLAVQKNEIEVSKYISSEKHPSVESFACVSDTTSFLFYLQRCDEVNQKEQKLHHKAEQHQLKLLQKIAIMLEFQILMICNMRIIITIIILVLSITYVLYNTKVDLRTDVILREATRQFLFFFIILSLVKQSNTEKQYNLLKRKYKKNISSSKGTYQEKHFFRTSKRLEVIK